MVSESLVKFLKKNPYYVMNDKQLAKLEEIEYGEVERHTNVVPYHDNEVKKKKRTRRRKKNG